MLGALVVSLGLDAADFISGMSKSEQQAKKFASTLDRNIAAGIIKAEVALRALGAAARTTAEVFDVLTSGAAKFQDLAEISGASAEGIASLQVSATGAGVEIESVVDSINKMTKALVGVDDESKAAGAALKALGIPIADFKKLDPVAQYEAIGRALAGFEDGAAKTAVAMALFGKTGAEQLRVFKDLEAQGGRQVILTQKQIEAADAYGDAMATAGAQLKLYAQAAATQALPALSDLGAAAAEFVKSLIGVDKATGQLAANNSVKAFATKAVDALAFVVDAGDGVIRVLNGIGLAGEALQKLRNLPMFGGFAEGSEIVKQLGRDLDALAQKELFSSRLAKQREQSAASGLADSLGLGAIDPQTKAPKKRLAFEGAVSGGGSAKKEVDRVAEAIKALNREIEVFGQDGDTLAKTLAFQDLKPTIAQLEQYKAGLASLEQLRAADAVKKMLDALVEERDALVLSKEQILARDLALKGATGTQVEFALEVSKSADAIRKQQEDQKRLQNILADTPTGQSKAMLEQIEFINAQFSAGNIASVEQWAEAIQIATGTLDKGIQDAGDRGIDVARELGLTFSSAFEDAIVAGKGLQDVLKGIEQDIIRIITRKLVTEPIGAAITGAIGGNTLSSLGGSLIGSLFGGSSAGAAAGGSDFAANFLSTFGGFFADGGGLPAGKWGIAGERGPELIRGPAHVVPTNRSMAMLDRMASQSRGGDRGNVFNTTFVLPPGGYSRATQQQIEAGMARSVAAANARLN